MISALEEDGYVKGTAIALALTIKEITRKERSTSAISTEFARLLDVWENIARFVEDEDEKLEYGYNWMYVIHRAMKKMVERWRE